MRAKTVIPRLPSAAISRSTVAGTLCALLVVVSDIRRTHSDRLLTPRLDSSAAFGCLDSLASCHGLESVLRGMGSGEWSPRCRLDLFLRAGGRPVGVPDNRVLE